jgi:hypothetical protein
MSNATETEERRFRRNVNIKSLLYAREILCSYRLNQDDNHNNDQIQLITIPNQQQPHNAVLKNIQ